MEKRLLEFFILGTIAVAIGTLAALAVAYYVSKDSISQQLSQSPIGKLLGAG